MFETAYIILPFVVFLINAFLAALVLRGEWSNPLHRLFAIFLAVMALWGFTIFGMRSSPDLATAFEWERWVFVVIVSASVLFYHFTLVFTGRRERGLLYVFYPSAVVVAVLSVGGLVATGMQQKFYGYAPVLGSAFPLYLAVAYLPIVMAWRMLWHRRRGLQAGEERTRVDYILVGVALSVAGATTDFLAPLGLRVYPMGIVMNIGFGAATTVAVTRYKLFGLRMLLRRGLYYFLLSTAIFSIYGGILLVFLLLFRSQSTVASVLGTVAGLLVVTLALPPAVQRAQRAADRLFFRERYDHLVAMQEFTTSTRDLADLVGLAASLENTVRLAMQADWAVVLVPDATGSRFGSAGAGQGAPDPGIATDSWTAAWLRDHAEVSLRSVDYDPQLQAMAEAERTHLIDSGAELLVSLRSKGELTGILALGPRIVDEHYAESDYRMLSAVASQTATMIENSRLYAHELDRLRELERLNNLKSNLLRTVSHELKSPITAVKTAVDLLGVPPEELSDGARTRLMRTLQNGIDRLQRLVAESLEYAQLQSADVEERRQPVHISLVVESAMALVGPSLSASEQHMVVEVDDELPALTADPEQLERIILNLLTNANKFTQRGGRIEVSATCEGPDVVIRVSDNGRGIAEAEQPYVFDQYYRGSEADRVDSAGTGLGLSIARQLTVMHGGDIAVSSTVGEGSCFTLRLPIEPSRPVDPNSDRIEPEPMSPQAPRQPTP